MTATTTLAAVDDVKEHAPDPKQGNFLTVEATGSTQARELPIFAKISQPSRYSVIAQTAVLATGIAIFKMLLTRYTSFVGYASLSDLGLIYTGLFFITGILFGQVTTDLKEAEKMPADMTANLEQIEDFFQLLSLQANKPDAFAKAQRLVLLFAFQWKQSVHDGQYPVVNDAINTLELMHDLTYQLDPKGGGFVVNLVNCFDKTRRVLLRASALARTSIIPSAHGLVQFFVLASTAILFFVKYNNEPTQLMIMICIYTVTWFSVRMVSAFDDPFEDEMFMGWVKLLGTDRLVHFFSLDEYALRLLKRTEKGMVAVCAMEDLLAAERITGEKSSTTTNLSREAQLLYRAGDYTGFAVCALGEASDSEAVARFCHE